MTYTVTDEETGEVVGEAEFTYTQELETSATSLLVDENDNLTMTAGEGELAGLAVEVVPSCGGPCSVTSGTWGGPLEQDVPLDGGAEYFANSLGVGQAAFLATSAEFTFTQTDAVPTETAVLNGPGDIRCDDIVSSNPGCVNASFTPDFQLSESDPSVDQAAVGILWAEVELPDHWGTSGHELHRLADPSKQATNRGKVCGSFVTDTSLNTNDSCDEYAFAASYESGGQLGLTTADCEEIWPFQDPGTGQWEVEIFRGNDLTEHCQVAHVDETKNELVGSRLGSAFTQTQRLLDGDPYTVTITA